MTTHLYRLAELASRDLDQIWVSVFDQSLNPEVADFVIGVIYDGFKFLGENPEAGHFREDLCPKPVKFWSVYSYLIIYRADNPIQIARIMPGQLDIATMLRHDPA